MNNSQITRHNILYIEKVTKGSNHDDEARIGKVSYSKTGQTIYYKDKKLQKIKGGGASSNYKDEATDQEYWVSGIKKEGSNRHRFGSGIVIVDKEAKSEFLKIKGENILNNKNYKFEEK